MKKLVAFLLTTMLLSPCLAASKPSHQSVINILTWWGYLKHPEIIKSVEKECGVQISFDEYYSNDEFLRRWEGQQENYDIIIFSDTIYNAIRKKIPRVKSELWKKSLLYNPVIKAHYEQRKYPHNIAYFLHSVTGFVWNPNIVTLSEKDSILDIFKKSKDKYVVIIDDAVEGRKLLEESISTKKTHAFLNFQQIIQNTHTYIGNEHSQIYNKKDFSFSYSWIGLAIQDILEFNKNHKFFIHPHLSYISSDLIAQTSGKKKAYCVANVLTNQKIISIVENTAFYFSPYLDESLIENQNFLNFYKKLKSSLPQLSWLEPIKKKELRQLNIDWQLMKISINQTRTKKTREKK